MAADSDGEPVLGCIPRPPSLGHKLGILGGAEPRPLGNIIEEDHDLIQTVFTCHGNLEDPDFPQRFSHLLEKLSSILCTGEEKLMQRVKKVEPWNSVRVTLNIPREAAARLRTLAAAGDAALQALGILSVQLEGDQVISLRLAARFGGEPQEIVLRTSNGPVEMAASTSSAVAPAGPVAALLNSVAGPSGSGSSGFRSPNVVAPAASSVIPPSPRPHSGPPPFPFTSMTHAAQTARQESPHHNFAAPPPYTAKAFTTATQRQNSTPILTPPPLKLPTPAPDTTVSLSSPLLVNLLQTDGKEAEPRPRQPPATPRARPRPPAPRPPPPPTAVPQQRFQASPPVVPPVTTTASSPALTTPPLRPAFTAASAPKEVIPPRSVIQSYSQFTASTSKPCSSTEIGDKSEEKNSSADGKKLIINPLTGELEPMPSESSESEEEPAKDDPFLYSSSPASRVFSDDDSMMSRRNDTSDQSDSETTSRSNGSEGAVRRRVLAQHKPPHHAQEKIKLRLMLDKSEPGQQVSSAPANAYKVDLTFSPSIRKAISSGNRTVASPPASAAAPPPTLPQTPSSCGMSAADEPRVPPLHISLRGRNATVVSNKKKSAHWLLDEELYAKLAKKKMKLGGGGSTKDGRDIIAINNCDLSQKPKRAKMKRIHGVTDGDGLKLKMAVMADPEMTDLCDEKLSKKRKDSKKVKNNVRHSESDSDGKGLKMDSEEWISRTLKEETLRNSVPLDSEVPASESAVSALTEATVATDDAADASRTSVFELSELLRCKKIENSNKKLDGLKVKNKLLDMQLEEPESGETTCIKKPQEIGGKIKSELSSKIDRVSGKLKNDLSKDGLGKKKSEDPGGKSIKTGIRPKVVKKEVGGVRLPTLSASSNPSETEDLAAFNRTKRRHSGDQSATESQAQKVKRSSSSDQPSPSCKQPTTNRRFDALTRKIRKESVIDRLRKDKMSKVVPLNAKIQPGCEPHNKKVHSSRLVSGGGKPVEKSPVVVAALSAVVEVKPALARLEGEAEKVKEGAGGAESSTQGEDSGIESMDALSEKSPNQGESPCRKEDDGKKGQNHDRTDEEEVKDLPDNSCLTMGNSNQETEPPQAHTVPFQCSSENNKSVEPEPETSTKLNEPVNSDGLIESFESKIREAFLRNEGLAAKILEGSSKDWDKEKGVKQEPTPDVPVAVADGDSSEPPAEGSNVDSKIDLGKDSIKEVSSPSLEDLERFRVNPPLYTYAKREDSLSPSPTTVEGNDHRNRGSLDDEPLDEDASNHEEKSTADHAQDLDSNHVRLEENAEPKAKLLESNAEDGSTTGRLLRHNKSLLEQLLIEIPPEDARRTRSWNKLGSSPGGTPKSSPRPGSPSVARPSPRTACKLSPTPRGSKRPSKRKCSENAAELIKACMGVDENKAGKTPTANTANTWKRGEVESSDDEPLSDLARSREQSVEQELKPGLLKPKLKQIAIEEESRNNNKVSMKVVTDTPTRRSVRQNQAGAGKTVRTVPDRTIRSTRSALSQESCETGNKRRRTSRDGK